MARLRRPTAKDNYEILRGAQDDRRREGGNDGGGGGLRGFLFQACHSFYLHSPVQFFFGDHPEGRGLFLL